MIYLLRWWRPTKSFVNCHYYFVSFVSIASPVALLEICYPHCTAWNWRTTFWFCCHFFFQLTQNWTALNFEVNFRPFIQWDSRGLFSKSLMKLSNLLSEGEIRTSEDVRASKKVKVWFYVLSQIYFETGTKPQKGIPCLSKCFAD